MAHLAQGCGCFYSSYMIGCLCHSSVRVSALNGRGRACSCFEILN